MTARGWLQEAGEHGLFGYRAQLDGHPGSSGASVNTSLIHAGILDSFTFASTSSYSSTSINPAACLMTVSYMNAETIIPRLAPADAMASLKTGASISRAVRMMASPDTPSGSPMTGPTLAATRNLMRTDSL